MGHGGRDRPDADPLGDLQLLRELDDLGREAVPLEVGLGAVEAEDVALTVAAAPHLERWPGQPLGLAVLDLERGPAGPEVEELVAVELGDEAALPAGLRLRRGCGGAAACPTG